MKARFEIQDESQFRLVGELNFTTVPALMAESAEIFKQGETITLMLDAVERIDSAGLALLVSLLRQAGDNGQELNFVGAPEQLLNLARVGGVDRVLSLN